MKTNEIMEYNSNPIISLRELAKEKNPKLSHKISQFNKYRKNILTTNTGLKKTTFSSINSLKKENNLYDLNFKNKKEPDLKDFSKFNKCINNTNISNYFSEGNFYIQSVTERNNKKDGYKEFKSRNTSYKGLNKTNYINDNLELILNNKDSLSSGSNIFIRKIDLELNNILNNKDKKKKLNFNSNNNNNHIYDYNNYNEKKFNVTNYFNLNKNKNFNIYKTATIYKSNKNINKTKINRKIKKNASQKIFNNISRKILVLSQKNSLISEENIINLIPNEKKVLDSNYSTNYLKNNKSTKKLSNKTNRRNISEDDKKNVILYPLLSEFALNYNKQIKLNENITNSNLKTPSISIKLNKSKSGKNIDQNNDENKKNSNEFYLIPDKFIINKNNKTNNYDEINSKFKMLKAANEEDKYLNINENNNELKSNYNKYFENYDSNDNIDNYVEKSSNKYQNYFNLNGINNYNFKSNIYFNNNNIINQNTIENSINNSSNLQNMLITKNNFLGNSTKTYEKDLYIKNNFNFNEFKTINNERFIKNSQKYRKDIGNSDIAGYLLNFVNSGNLIYNMSQENNFENNLFLEIEKSKQIQQLDQQGENGQNLNQEKDINLTKNSNLKFKEKNNSIESQKNDVPMNIKLKSAHKYLNLKLSKRKRRDDEIRHKYLKKTKKTKNDKYFTDKTRNDKSNLVALTKSKDSEKEKSKSKNNISENDYNKISKNNVSSKKVLFSDSEIHKNKIIENDDNINDNRDKEEKAQKKMKKLKSKNYSSLNINNDDNDNNEKNNKSKSKRMNLIKSPKKNLKTKSHNSNNKLSSNDSNNSSKINDKELNLEVKKENEENEYEEEENEIDEYGDKHNNLLKKKLGKSKRIYYNELSFLEDKNLDIKEKLRLIKIYKDKAIMNLYLIVKQILEEKKDLTLCMETLIKFLLIKSYKKYINIMKLLTVKGRILSGLDNITTNTIDVKQEEIIKYIYRLFSDESSPYNLLGKPKIQNSISSSSSFLKKHNLGKLSQKKYKIMNEMRIQNSPKRKKVIKESKKINLLSKLKKGYDGNMEQKNFHQFIYEEISPDKQKQNFFTQKINLTNELKYQIEITQNQEGKNRFKVLLDQIESLKNESVKDYIKILRDNYDLYKREILELIKTREKEERINNFLLDLFENRDIISKRKVILEEMLHMEDNKFESSMS